MSNSEKTMASGKEFIVDDSNNPIGQYISYVKEIYELEIKRAGEKAKEANGTPKNKHLFFRGQADVSWSLTPKVLREKNYKEKDLVLDFYHYGPLHSFNYDLDNDRLSLLTDMQHYEVPTRLLDWSLSPLSSLYFAVEKATYPQQNAVVYILNPWSFNEKILENNNRRYRFSEKLQDSYLLARALLSTYKDFDYIKKFVYNKYGFKITKKDIRDPFALVSNFTNNRMLHQRGVFTIHGTKDSDLIKDNTFKINAYKIIIKKCLKEDIYNQLNWMYINEYTQYPDIKGIKEMVAQRKGFFNI